MEVEDAIAIPGSLCEDVASTPEDVTCRDAWSYLDLDDGEPGTEPEPQPNDPEPETSWMDGPFYWIAVISLVGLLIASIVTINQNLRGKFEEEE